MKKLYVIFLGFILTTLFVTNVCAADESTMIVVNNTSINETGKAFNNKFLVLHDVYLKLLVQKLNGMPKTDSLL